MEAKVREHLDREDLGMPYKELMSVKAVLATFFMNQMSNSRRSANLTEHLSMAVWDMVKV